MAQHTIQGTLLLLAALTAVSGVASAVKKVGPSKTAQQNPCSGTKDIDTLIGTSGTDSVVDLAGNDTTDGGVGDDSYSSYNYGWGTGSLVV